MRVLLPRSPLIDEVLTIAPAVAHVAQRRLGDPEVAVDVDHEGVLPLLVVEFVERVDRLLVGDIVDQHVEAAQLAHGLLDHLGALVGSAQVAGQQQAAPALLLGQLAGVLGVLALGEIGDRDVGAFLREGPPRQPCRSRSRRR